MTTSAQPTDGDLFGNRAAVAGDDQQSTIVGSEFLHGEHTLAHDPDTRRQIKQPATFKAASSPKLCPISTRWRSSLCLRRAPSTLCTWMATCDRLGVSRTASRQRSTLPLSTPAASPSELLLRDVGAVIQFLPHGGVQAAAFGDTIAEQPCVKRALPGKDPHFVRFCRAVLVDRSRSSPRLHPRHLRRLRSGQSSVGPRTHDAIIFGCG